MAKRKKIEAEAAIPGITEDEAVKLAESNAQTVAEIADQLLMGEESMKLFNETLDEAVKSELPEPEFDDEADRKAKRGAEYLATTMAMAATPVVDYAEYNQTFIGRVRVRKHHNRKYRRVHKQTHAGKRRIKLYSATGRAQYVKYAI